MSNGKKSFSLVGTLCNGFIWIIEFFFKIIGKILGGIFYFLFASPGGCTPVMAWIILSAMISLFFWVLPRIRLDDAIPLFMALTVASLIYGIIMHLFQKSIKHGVRVEPGN